MYKSTCIHVKIETYNRTGLVDRFFRFYYTYSFLHTHATGFLTFYWCLHII